MKVRRIGISLTNKNKTIRFSDFINYLIPFNGERMGFDGGERFFLFHEDDVFFQVSFYPLRISEEIVGQDFRMDNLLSIQLIFLMMKS